MNFHLLSWCLAAAISVVPGILTNMAVAAPEKIEADFYVAPDGDDANSGTLQKPFRTLQRARDAVRTLKNNNTTKDVFVLFRGGQYRFTDTIIFGLEDSATKGCNIIYAAYPGERPIFSAGVPVTGWKKVSGELPGLPQTAKGKLWCAPVPEGIGYFTCLFDEHFALPRSRSQGYRPTKITKSNTKTYFPAGLMPIDANERGMDLSIVPNYPWVVNLLPISEVDPNTATATTSVPATYPLNKPRFGYFPQGTAWIENAVEFIDEPGEWALDKKTRLIYLWHESNKPPAGIVVPKLTELVRVEGKIDYNGPTDEPVRGLVFRGLTFTHADHWRWQQEKTGWGLQHDWEMFDRPTAMLRFRGAEDCAVEKCVFTNAGSAAIRCDLHARKIRIMRNHIHNVGGVGVLLAGYGPGSKDVNRDNVVVHNHIHHIGQILWHAPGIFAWQSGGNRIAHNHVHDTAYTAIVVSGRIIWRRQNVGECVKTIRWKEIDRATAGASKESSWGRGGTLASWRRREPFLHGRHNMVEYNDIHHCMRILGDGNGIYISGTGDANQVRYNHIHDVDTPSVNAAIRCDDDQHGTIIHGNIIANCCGEGFIIKGANTITNNIVYALRSKTTDGIECLHQRGYVVLPYRDCTGAVIARNIFFAVEKDARVLTERRTGTKRHRAAMLSQCRADKNLYFNTADPQWGSRHFAAQRRYGVEKNSIAADPLFVNPAKGDFRLEKHSPALKLGFEQIDQSRIGLSSTKNPE